MVTILGCIRTYLTKVEGEGVEHVLLGVGKGRVLRDLRPAELCVSDGSGHLVGFCVVRCVGRKGSRKPLAQKESYAQGRGARLCVSDFTSGGARI